MRKFIQLVCIVLITGAWTASTDAQEKDLVSVGSFVYTYTPPTTVIGGAESYVIECDQNFDNIWPFGSNLDDHGVALCPQSYDTEWYNCVHFMEIRISLARPYSSSNFEMIRFRPGVHEIFFDGNFIAKGRSSCGWGMQANNTYNLGFLSPGRIHTLAVTSSLTSNPFCGFASEVLQVYGFAVRGIPMSDE
jgi:hypothetical protein